MIMTPGLITAHRFIAQICALPRTNQSPYKSLKTPSSSSSSSIFLSKSMSIPRFSTVCRRSTSASQNSLQSPSKALEETTSVSNNSEELQSDWKVEVGSPNVESYVPPAGLSLNDRASFLLAIITCTTSIGFASFVIAAVPALHAMGRAAISLSKLADTAREELPSTMAAVRLSGMEISDLTLELSDLSQEIADGVNKSAEAVQAAEVGIRQIGSLTRHKTMAMIKERANLPVISVKPVVAGAAKKTSQAVGQATRALLSIFSPGELSSKNEPANAIDRLEI